MNRPTLVIGILAGIAFALIVLGAAARIESAPPPTTGAVTIVLELQPDVANEVCFLRNLPSPEAFCLGDGESEYIEGILGLLDVHVVNTSGVWHVKAISCEPGIPAIATVLASGSFFVPISAGDDLECTYVVEFLGIPPTAVPTSTSTSTPTSTPTLSPTATFTATATLSPTATPVPSSTPLPLLLCSPTGPVVNLALGQQCPASAVVPAVVPSVSPSVPRITAPNTGDAGLVQD